MNRRGFHTEPISKPITPEPMTPSLAGHFRSRFNATFIVPIRLHCRWQPTCKVTRHGNRSLHDDVFGFDNGFLAFACRLRFGRHHRFFPANEAVPNRLVAYFFWNRNFTPPVSLVTMASLRAIIFAASNLMSPTLMPYSANHAAQHDVRSDCNRALEGMQPTFRQVPPAQTSPALLRRPHIDTGGFQTQLGSADGGNISAGTCANDYTSYWGLKNR